MATIADLAADSGRWDRSLRGVRDVTPLRLLTRSSVGCLRVSHITWSPKHLGHDRAEEHGGIGDEPQRMYAEVAQRRRMVDGNDASGA